MSKKIAIVTSFWDGPDKNLDFFDKAVLPRFKYISEKWKADLVIETEMSEFVKNNRLNQWVQKSINIKKNLKLYDRILYLDNDCVISRSTPNLFAIYPESFVYAVLDGPEGDANCFSRCEEMHQLQAYFGSINWTFGYYNAGVILADKEHHYIFKDNLKCNTPYGDQGLFNYFLRKYGFKHKNLGRAYNSMSINVINPEYPISNKGLYPPEELVRGAYIAHAAGVGVMYGQRDKDMYIHKLNLLMP
jgi:lipopolysaccharide biosynthesis glycosyltransferase